MMEPTFQMVKSLQLRRVLLVVAQTNNLPSTHMWRMYARTTHAACYTQRSTFHFPDCFS